MFTGMKYITKGIESTIPRYLQHLLWYLIGTLEDISKDYLQVFQLEMVQEGGKTKQKIIHIQEQPEYRKEYVITASHPVEGTVFVIDDKSYCTMLLANEY